MRILVFIFIFFLTYSLSVAESPTTPSATIGSEKLEKIRELKERVASKVAQLRQNRQTVFEGEIKKLEKNGFTIVTNGGEKTFQITKETEFYWINTTGKKLVINFGNMEIGDFVALFGKFAEEETFVPEIVVGKMPIFFLAGTVTKVDQEKKTFNISLREKNNPITIAVSPNTLFFSINKLRITPEGKFSDISLGKKVFIRGSYKEKNKEEVLAYRIVTYD